MRKHKNHINLNKYTIYDKILPLYQEILTKIYMNTKFLDINKIFP